MSNLDPYTDWHRRAAALRARDGFLNSENIQELGPCPTEQRIQSKEKLKMSDTEQLTPNDKQGFIEAFDRLVCAERTRHPHLTRLQCVGRVARTHKVLHQKYIEATNPNFAFPK